MYNMAFGPTEQKIPAIAVCGIDPEKIGRYRDVWMERDGESEDSLIIAVYTRNGGGNREDYAEQIAYMQGHPQYVEDSDDSFDSTYATFRFRVRESDLDLSGQERWGVPREQWLDREETWGGLNLAAVDRIDTDERWREAIAAIGEQ